MFADNFTPAIAGINAKYQYASYNFRSVMGPVARSVLGNQTIVYPLTVTPIGTGTPISRYQSLRDRHLLPADRRRGCGGEERKGPDASGTNPPLRGIARLRFFDYSRRQKTKIANAWSGTRGQPRGISGSFRVAF